MASKDVVINLSTEMDELSVVLAKIHAVIESNPSDSVMDSIKRFFAECKFPKDLITIKTGSADRAIRCTVQPSKKLLEFAATLVAPESE